VETKWYTQHIHTKSSFIFKANPIKAKILYVTVYIIMMMIIIIIIIIIYSNKFSVNNTGLYLAQDYPDQSGICFTWFRITEGPLHLNNIIFKNMY
jgi:hypothetical protein